MSSNWPIKKISEVANFLNHKRVPLKSLDRDKRQGEFPYYGASGIVDHIDDYIFNGTYLLISEDGENLRTRNTPIAFKATGKFWVNNHAHILEEKEEGILDYLEYYFSILDINAYITGAVQPKLNKANLDSIEIPIPPRDERLEINATLNSLTNKIHLNTQTNQTLESIAQAIFKSWFVDFEPVKAKMAVLAEGGTREQAELAAMGAISGLSTDGANAGESELAQLQQQNPERYQQLAETAALFPSAMVESELGGIPEGWGVGSIGDIALAKGGYAFKSNEFEATGNKVVKIKNITGDGRVDLTDCDCVKHPQPEKLDRFKITNGDLLMAMTGATVGKIGIAVSGNDYVYLNQRVAKFESKIKTKKVSWFLFPCIQQKSIFDTIVGSAQGSAQPNISSTEIERTEIVVPDENLISKYCDLVDPFFKKWMANNILNTELANLRDSLLPKLLSGEIDLSDIQSEVA